MKSNSVVLFIGRVHSGPVNSHVKEFRVKCYNTVDMVCKHPQNNNDEVVPGYLEAEALEDILEVIRRHIDGLYPCMEVTETILEEDCE